jgi:hypothetical protein
VIVAALTVASVWYIMAPPRGESDYRERAFETAQALRSHVQSTRIWVRTLQRGGTLRSSATVAFREAEEDATKVASGFASYQPPPGTDGLRSAMIALASDVEDALAAVRIAAQREQWSSVPEAAAPLADLSGRLRGLVERAGG